MTRRIKTFVIVIVAVQIFAVSYIALNFIVNVRYDTAKIRSDYALYLKNEFNRTVKMDDLSIDLFLNVKISGVTISGENDFNNSNSVIYCDAIVLKPYILSLLSGKLRIKEAFVESPAISINKQFGRTYEEMFNDLLDGNSRKNILLALSGIRKISCSDGSLTYDETLKKNSLQASFKSIDVELVNRNGEFHISGFGTLDSLDGKEENSSFKCQSLLIPSTDGTVERGFCSISGDRVNLSILSKYPVLTDRNASLAGIANISVTSETFLNHTSISGNCVVLNSKFSYIDSGEQRDIISNDTVKASFSLADDALDKNLALNLSTESGLSSFISIHTVNTNNKNYSDISASLKCSDLSEFSEYVTPVKGMKFSGKINGEMNCRINNVDGNISLAEGFLSGEHFGITTTTGGTVAPIIENSNLNLKVRDYLVTLSTTIHSGKSDIAVSGYSDINDWTRYSANSQYSINSDNVEFSKFRAVVERIFSSIYSVAQNDRAVGYNENYFRNKLLGKIAVNNTIVVPVSFKRLSFNKNAFLSDIKAEFHILNSTADLSLLEARGYDASYSFSFQSFINSDYPVIKGSYSVSNFNLSHFFQDAQLEGSIENAVLGFDGTVESSAFRPSHLIENTKQTFSLRLSADNVSGTLFQKQINAIFKKENADCDALVLNGFKASYSTESSATRTYLKEFSVSSDLLRISGYGTVDSTGVSSPITIDYKDISGKNGTLKLRVSAPFWFDSFYVKYAVNGRDETVNLL